MSGGWWYVPLAECGKWMPAFRALPHLIVANTF